jgi:hypothetical protein
MKYDTSRHCQYDYQKQEWITGPRALLLTIEHMRETLDTPEALAILRPEEVSAMRAELPKLEAEADSAIVVVTEANGNGTDPVEAWRGRLAQLEADNCFDAEEISDLRKALRRDGRYVTGGGAAALFTVELAETRKG